MKAEKFLWLCTSALLLFVGISSVAGGLALIIDPSGISLRMTTDLLLYSPFKNFFIPGLILFTVNGIGSLIVSHLNYKKHRNAGPCTIILGFSMIIWIVAEVYWMGWLLWLQPLYLIIGFIEIILGYLFTTQNRLIAKKLRKYDDNFQHLAS